MEVEVLIEVPRGGFVKRELQQGRLVVDYVAAVPSPFNYGCLPDDEAPDGDPPDAIVLGPRRAAGSRVRGAVVAVVRFRDAGLQDDKLVVQPGGGALGPGDRRALLAFFRVYAVARRALNRVRGLRGETRFLGLDAG